MTIVAIVDGIVKWAQEAICDKVSLKVPDDDVNDNNYPGERITPSAFPLFVPAKDRLPPKVAAPIPSICVQIKEGKDTPVDGKRVLKMRLNLATWNPGEHGTEIVTPQETDGVMFGKVYRRHSDPEAAASYTRNMDGWRDLWNFADVALHELEGTEYIAGLRLVKEGEGITFGPFTEEGAIWDYYPYWFLWIDFALECGVVHREPEVYKNLL